MKIEQFAAKFWDDNPKLRPNRKSSKSNTSLIPPFNSSVARKLDFDNVPVKDQTGTNETSTLEANTSLDSFGVSSSTGDKLVLDATSCTTLPLSPPPSATLSTKTPPHSRAPSNAAIISPAATLILQTPAGKNGLNGIEDSPLSVQRTTSNAKIRDSVDSPLALNAKNLDDFICSILTVLTQKTIFFQNHLKNLFSSIKDECSNDIGDGLVKHLFALEFVLRDNEVSEEYIKIIVGSTFFLLSKYSYEKQLLKKFTINNQHLLSDTYYNYIREELADEKIDEFYALYDRTLKPKLSQDIIAHYSIEINNLLTILNLELQSLILEKIIKSPEVLTLLPITYIFLKKINAINITWKSFRKFKRDLLEIHKNGNEASSSAVDSLFLELTSKLDPDDVNENIKKQKIHFEIDLILSDPFFNTARERFESLVDKLILRDDSFEFLKITKTFFEELKKDQHYNYKKMKEYKENLLTFANENQLLTAFNACVPDNETLLNQHHQDTNNLLNYNQKIKLQELMRSLDDKKKPVPNKMEIIEATLELIEEYRKTKTESRNNLDYDWKISFNPAIKAYENKLKYQYSTSQKCLMTAFIFAGALVGAVLGFAAGVTLGALIGGGAGSVVPMWGNIGGAIIGGSFGGFVTAIKGAGSGAVIGSIVGTAVLGVASLAGTAAFEYHSNTPTHIKSAKNFAKSLPPAPHPRKFFSCLG